MHVVTFYSYKGGVGRTMALVNTAAILAQRGRKVLIVDFDLEAPGISTYAPFYGLAKSKGVVEYVSEYVKTAVAPAVDDFIVECELGNAKVWAMPAGVRNREYSIRLNTIDWQTLYSVQSGYLFFEDLKQQWQKNSFDYVLIDSRTGHTDVGGICTRQLPDTVVLMFFPNDQNLMGLETVVRDIREEPRGLRKKDIILQFCASNVPDLDDEDHILERKLSEAKKVLRYSDNPSLIRHYNSLTLLEQSVFALDRPESRLALEYKNLVSRIVSQNLEDPEGAITVLHKLRDTIRRRVEGADTLTSKTLDEIRDLHPNDGEIAWVMAHVFSLIGDLANETERLSVAIEANVNANNARRRRAAIAQLQGRHDDAESDLLTILEGKSTTAVEFVAAVELLREVEVDWLSVVLHSDFLGRLDAEQSIRLGKILMSDLRGNDLVISMMKKVMGSLPESDSNFRAAKTSLLLASISSNQFQAALDACGIPREEMLLSKDMSDVFNFAMAEWGKNGRPSRDLMAHVVQLANLETYRDVNRHQCFALAHHISGSKTAAKIELDRAIILAGRFSGRQFSCWRYLEVNKAQMMEDIREMETFFDGGGNGPKVFNRDGADRHEGLLN